MGDGFCFKLSRGFRSIARIRPKSVFTKAKVSAKNMGKLMRKRGELLSFGVFQIQYKMKRRFSIYQSLNAAREIRSTIAQFDFDPYFQTC